MLIDTHCHLNFNAFNKDLPDVLRRAKEAGVEKIIIPGTDIASSKKAIEVANSYDFCWASVGIHPHHAHDPGLVIDAALEKQLEKILTSDRVVAVGEIGLDYFRYTKTKYSDNSITDEIKQKQKELLLMQLDLAVIHNLPVIFHCREAFDDMLEVIRNQKETNSRKSSARPNYIKQSQTVKPVRGVFHCFTGSTSQLQLITTMGYYVGFDGNITYDETQYSPLVSSAPLDRILLETDSPYLTPVPYRGTRNEPMHLPLVAEAVAKYRATTLSEITKFTTSNAEKLFEI